jgi:hypothetical protein
MLIAIPLFIWIFSNKYLLSIFLKICGTKYIRGLIYGLLLLNFIALFYPVVFKTFDISYFRITGMQIAHLICALPFLVFIYYYQFSTKTVESFFIYIFIFQTIIQIVAFLNPGTFGEFVRLFNRYDLIQDRLEGILGGKVRGYALSAATTYHLSLVYGVAFILALKKLVETNKKYLIIIIQGIFVFIGIFFPGRTGFVGVAISGIYFLVTTKINVMKKIKIIMLLFDSSLFICILILTIAPKQFRENITNVILPYAFEIFYNKNEKGSFTMTSSGDLMEQWNKNYDLNEVVLGSGKYTNKNGSYYMRTDIGYFRTTLFSGIIGYLFVLMYQYMLFPLDRIKRKDRIFYGLIMLYFLIMELKATTIGLNKFVFSTCILLSFSNIYIPDNCNEDRFINIPIIDKY